MKQEVGLYGPMNNFPQGNFHGTFSGESVMINTFDKNKNQLHNDLQKLFIEKVVNATSLQDSQEQDRVGIYMQGRSLKVTLYGK